jgi:hypothetical protein
MRFKFSQNVKLDDFILKIKKCLEDSSLALKKTSEKVFLIRVAMEREGITYGQIIATLNEARTETEDSVVELGDYMESLSEFEKTLQEIQKQQEENQVAPAIQEEDEDELQRR